jgi:hypothetical protein
MATREERIKALKDKAEKLRVRAEKLEQAEAKQARTNIERRKYVIGASILAAIKEGAAKEEEIVALVDRFHGRTQDRALFGLAPLPTQEQPVPTQA